MVSFLYLFITVGDTTVRHLLLYYTFSQLYYSAMEDFPQIYKMKYKLAQYAFQNL